MTARNDETREHPDPTADLDVRQVLTAYDWGALGDVVDVGGDGTLLIALLNEFPSLRGTVLDHPATAEAARKRIAAAGLEDRCGTVAADIFAEVPAGAEGYLLTSLVRDRGHDDARRILARCAEAAGEDGAVFVIEADHDVAGLTALAESSGLAVADTHDGGEVVVLELSVP